MYPQQTREFFPSPVLRTGKGTDPPGEAATELPAADPQIAPEAQASRAREGESTEDVLGLRLSAAAAAFGGMRMNTPHTTVLLH